MSTARYRITLELIDLPIATVVKERIAGRTTKTTDHVWRLGSAIMIDTNDVGAFLDAYYKDGFEYDLDICQLPS